MPKTSIEPALCRCSWCGTDPLYVAYHDEEWGVPEYDGRALFEKLILDGFQAGLSWITILRKRDAFRTAFDQFDPEVIVRYDAAKVAELMGNAGIVRNRAKIEGTVASARAYLALGGAKPFSNLIWDFFDGAPLRNTFASRTEIPAATPVSIALSKELKRRGFAFCGPTIVYAFAQACGLVNDHVATCFREAECAGLARKPKR
jgi:DNA-3-methyladenine glycosylase I